MLSQTVNGLFSSHRTGMRLLLGVTVLKMVGFGLLSAVGLTGPFVGANAVDHYLPVADRMLEQHRFNGPDTRPDSKIGPAYPFLLAALKFVTPAHYLLVVVWLQMLGDLVVAACLYRLGQSVSQGAAGGLAAVGWLLYPPAIVMSTWITADTIFAALMILGLVFVYRAALESERSWQLTCAAGLLIGLATLFRPTTLLLIVFLLPFWISEKRLSNALVFLVAMSVLIAPWTVRNWMVLEDRIVVATGTGSPFLLGTDEDEVQPPEKKDKFFAAAVREAAAVGIQKPSEPMESKVDGYFFQMGLLKYKERARTRPLSFVPLFFLKFVRLWYATDMAKFKMQLALGLCSLAVVPLGLRQICRWWATRRRLLFVFGGVVLYFIGMHMVLLPLQRYTLPIYPILILAAAEQVWEWMPLGNDT